MTHLYTDLARLCRSMRDPGQIFIMILQSFRAGWTNAIHFATSPLLRPAVLDYAAAKESQMMS